MPGYSPKSIDLHLKVSLAFSLLELLEDNLFSVVSEGSSSKSFDDEIPN